jgi:hypothetical protein
MGIGGSISKEALRLTCASVYLRYCSNNLGILKPKLTYTEQLPRQCSQTTPPEALPQLGSTYLEVCSYLDAFTAIAQLDANLRSSELGGYTQTRVPSYMQRTVPALFRQYQSSTNNRSRGSDWIPDTCRSNLR